MTNATRTNDVWEGIAAETPGPRHRGSWPILATIGLALACAIWSTNAIAGALGGAKFGLQKRVAAHGADVFVVTFVADEAAAVVVSGDGDTDLDLAVYDEFGHLVAADFGPTDACSATWTPRWTGPFRIVVRNCGAVFNDYGIVTN